MSTLNKLPDGTPSPRYKCTAINYEGEEQTAVLIEWWFEGKQVESIEQSAESYFYDAFDKAHFNITSIVKVKANETNR